MKAKKTILAVLVILFLLFYIISMAYIDSQRKIIRDMRNNSWSRSGGQTYFQSHSSRPTPRPSSRPAPRSAPRSGSATREIETGPSTDGFYHAEDFYEWYKDDFIDYEDAEEYYESHGG